MKNMEKVLDIYKTTDYKRFKLLKENRDTDHWQTIKGSIEEKDLTMYKPVLVNSKFEIIDGQGTYMACKYLKKPIHFVIGEDIGSSDLPRLNTTQTNWKPGDWLKHYVARKFPHYRKVQEMMEETGFSVRDICNIWAQDQVERATVAFKHGTYTLSEIGIERIRNMRRAMNLIEEYWPADQERKPTNQSTMIAGMRPLFVNPEFEWSNMLDTIERFPFMMGYKNTKAQYEHMFRAIYNRTRRGKNRLL